jgi:hypothetical protein
MFGTGCCKLKLKGGGEYSGGLEFQVKAEGRRVGVAFSTTKPIIAGVMTPAEAEKAANTLSRMAMRLRTTAKAAAKQRTGIYRLLFWRRR